MTNRNNNLATQEDFLASNSSDEQRLRIPGKRGLAAADEQTRIQVARKGGEAVSQNRAHMAQIGRKGGEASHGRRRSPGTLS